MAGLPPSHAQPECAASNGKAGLGAQRPRPGQPGSAPEAFTTACHVVPLQTPKQARRL